MLYTFYALVLISVLVNRPNCLAKLPFSTKIIQNQKAKTELDVIVTENSDSYFLRY